MKFERHRVNRRVIDDLKNRSTMGMYFYVAIALAVLVADDFHERHFTFSVVFLCAMTGVALFRIVHSRIFDKIDQLNSRLNYAAFFTSVYLTPLVWGSGFAYCLIQPDETLTQMLMLVSTAGLNAGGVVAFIPSRSLSIGYNFLMLTPAILILGYLGVSPYLVFLMVSFVAYMTIIALRGNREYWDALENEHKLRIKTRELEKLSRLDSLTGLYNRNHFDTFFAMHFKSAARNRMRITLIIGDIDFFKPINDTYGHLAGDAYLEKIALILSETFKRDTDFVGRYGGEEFVVLLLNQETEQAMRLCEQVRAKVENLVFPYYDHRIQATMSFGIADFVPDIDDDCSRLFEKADKALYRAKNSGRNQVVVYDEETENP